MSRTCRRPAGRPRIFTQPVAGVKTTEIVTTDFFAFDDTSNTFGISGLGLAVEMGDAVLGMVIKQIGAGAPRSGRPCEMRRIPEINSDGLTKKEAATKAAQIYERFGYWTTIPSAIACWALVIDN